jgi:hypothetical protein
MTESTIGSSRSLDRPVHAACVVARCWCGGSARSAARPEAARRSRTAAASRPIDLTAWRSVGLPVA